jgi:hypothetical protein
VTPQQYYARVFDRLERCFAHAHYVVAAGSELLEDGWDPSFPVAVEPVDRLARFTLEKGMQVHLPVIGKKSRSVLMPIDVEVFLLGENHLLYTDRGSQRFWFEQAAEVIRFFEGLLRERGIPYLLDYTPSGAHFLWHNPMGTGASRALEQIGVLEADVVSACQYVDPRDIKRWWGVDLAAARVFSGLGRLTEYLSLEIIAAFDAAERPGALPVTVSDSEDRCINLDNSWCEGSPFMRSIRSPFSLHKKNQQKHGMTDRPPLVDVVGAVFDGRTAQGETTLDRVLECMWDLEKAAERAQELSGTIPSADDSLIALVDEYRQSALYPFHRAFDETPDLPRGEALARGWHAAGSSDPLRRVLEQPNPLALQPKNMRLLVRELGRAGWPAKHVANLLRDLYIDPRHGWTIDFFKYPAEEKANFWARTFAALEAMKAGRLAV